MDVRDDPLKVLDSLIDQMRREGPVGPRLAAVYDSLARQRRELGMPPLEVPPESAEYRRWVGRERSP